MTAGPPPEPPAPAPAPLRCSVAAAAAGDPPEGTAPPAQRWFLVEHPGPWGRLALTGSGLDPDAVAALSAWAGPADARVVLVRRPGRRDRSPRPRRWFRVDARPGHEEIRTGGWRDGAELAAAVHEPGEPVAGPLTLVCVHGRHDTCCALRGRPVAAALAAADPGGTWECSHVGGCRFAPAVVLLPHGFTVGGVDPAEAVGLASRYARGEIDPHRLRGRSSLAPAVQAAQSHARGRTGATGVDALRPVATSRTDDGGWRVELAGPDCTVLLGERHVTVDRPLTCAARPAGRIRVFDLVDLTLGPPG